jgi:hypothetical protein
MSKPPASSNGPASRSIAFSFPMASYILTSLYFRKLLDVGSAPLGASKEQLLNQDLGEKPTKSHPKVFLVVLQISLSFSFLCYLALTIISSLSCSSCKLQYVEHSPVFIAGPRSRPVSTLRCLSLGTSQHCLRALAASPLMLSNSPSMCSML